MAVGAAFEVPTTTFSMTHLLPFPGPDRIREGRV